MKPLPENNRRPDGSDKISLISAPVLEMRNVRILNIIDLVGVIGSPPKLWKRASEAPLQRPKPQKADEI